MHLLPLSTFTSEKEKPGPFTFQNRHSRVPTERVFAFSGTHPDRKGDSMASIHRVCVNYQAICKVLLSEFNPQSTTYDITLPFKI